MIHRPYRFHTIDDDHAPVDYTYVPSVNEGRRRQQAQNIKRSEPQNAVVRHRADPFEREAVDKYGTRARHFPGEPGARETVMRKLPSIADGPAPAASVAYPEDYGIPENPFDPPTEARQSVRQGREPAKAARQNAGPTPQPGNGARIAMPQPEPPSIVTQDGSQYDPPVKPPMPEWLRVAQQNNMPMEERRSRAPRVLAAPNHEPEAEEAPRTDLLGRPIRSRVPQQRPNVGELPRTADEYGQAGYPPELLKQQEQMERQRSEQGLRRRHGAQFAVNQYRQQEYEQSTGMPAQRGQSSYPPSRESYARRQATPEEGRGDAPAYDPQGQAVERGAAYAAVAGRGRYARRAPDRADYPGTEDVHAAAYGPEASNPYAHPGRPAPPQNPYPPEDAWQDEESDQMPMYEERPPIPWLGIGVFAAAFIAVALWLMQLTFTSQTDQVIRARKESSEALRNNHPYRYEELIKREAENNNLHPAFVAAIVLNESSFNPSAESNVGARGLMQVMDGTARFVYEKKNATLDGYDFDALYVAETNVEFGCWYLSYLSERFRGDPVLMAAGYHAGPNEVQNWLNDSTYSADNLTLEIENMKDGPTKQYATRVLRDYAIYKKLYFESTEGNS